MESRVIKSYEGFITPEPDTIFVFGSNPEGRHGAGSAKVAVQQFGAKYGQGEGLQGMSYALPTTDLRKRNRPSMTKEEIVDNIRRMYNVARENPRLTFKVAYTNKPDEVTLCGYSGRDMMDMFTNAGAVPDNVMFSSVWAADEKFRDDYITDSQVEKLIVGCDCDEMDCDASPDCIIKKLGKKN